MISPDGRRGADSVALLDHHRRLLADSGISDEVAAERGYRSAVKRVEVEKLGFKRFQCNVPALVIPIRDVRGEIVTYQVRPDQPRIGDNGRPVKYETPAATPPALDVPLRVGDLLGSSAVALWITEGTRKADAAATAGLCCVSLPGVWSWARRLNGDARQVLPDLQRLRLHERKVIVAFDSDAMVKASVHAALEALAGYLTSQGAIVMFLYLPELEPGVKAGLDDYLAAGHTIEYLWLLTEPDLRPLPEPEPPRPALPTATLLWAVEELLRRFVVFATDDGHELAALSLYVLHTWAFPAAHATPYLFVKSPTKRAGKSRLLEVLKLACRNAIMSASITEAALFQAVAAFKPTLLIDEVDALFSSRSERAEALRGVLNAGNRPGSDVIRGTQDGEPAIYSVFCPKVLSGIDNAKLPDTIRDRSIIIGLERKLRTQPVDRLRERDLEGAVEDLHGRLADWAAEHGEQLASYRLAEPITEITDRLEEGWEPLLAIAALAGDEWLVRARAAAIALAEGADDVGDADHGQALLEALAAILTDETPAMFTKDICSKLNELDELPFGALRRGDGIDARGVGRLLKPYGIKSRNVRVLEKQAKGFSREQFVDAWARYTPETPPAHGATEAPSHPSQRSMDPKDFAAELARAGTDKAAASVPHPSQPHTRLQSQETTAWDGGPEGTDEMPPSARGTFSANGDAPRLADVDPDQIRTAFPGSQWMAEEDESQLEDNHADR